jgi:hypothetical protein
MQPDLPVFFFEPENKQEFTILDGQLQNGIGSDILSSKSIQVRGGSHSLVRKMGELTGPTLHVKLPPLCNVF